MSYTKAHKNVVQHTFQSYTHSHITLSPFQLYTHKNIHKRNSITKGQVIRTDETTVIKKKKKKLKNETEKKRECEKTEGMFNYLEWVNAYY